MRATSKLKVAAFIVGVLLVMIATSAATSSPRSCEGCHVMRPYADALSETAHLGLDCLDCHLADATWSWPGFKVQQLGSMYPAAFFGADEVTGPGMRVDDRTCLSCHAGIRATVTEAYGLRFDHEACTVDGTPCDACHGPTMHPGASRWERSYVMEYCVRCHNELGVSNDCDFCHEGRLERDRLERGPWQVTHGPEWRQTHGMGTLSFCQTCHEPVYCADCHGVPLPHPAGFPNTHGQDSLAEGAGCETCHDRAAFCDACHGLAMPHPNGFLAKHSDEASDTDDPSCTSCHPSNDCIECHIDHTHPGRTEGTLGRFETDLGGE